MKTLDEKHRKKLRRGWPELVLGAIVSVSGIAAVWTLARMAIMAGKNGVIFTGAIGIILAIVLAFLDRKVKDVLLK